MAKALFYLLILQFLLCFSCGKGDNAFKGGSTETIGAVVDSCGIPVAGVSIVLVKSDFDPIHDASHFDTLYSDSLGVYNFLSVEDGIYNLQIGSENQCAFRNNVVVQEGELEESIVDTLTQTGSLKGVVQYQHGDNHKGIFIIFLGTERYTTTIDSTGTFRIDNLAEGDYQVKIITESKEYENVEKSVSIVSGVDGILKDTVVLSYIAIPTPENVAVIFDTLLQETKITWSSVESDSLLGYYIYRAVGAENTRYSLLCDSLLTEPFFRDSKLPFDAETLQVKYRIHAVHMNGLSGKFSRAVSTAFCNNYCVAEVFPLPFEFSGLLKATYTTHKGELLFSSSGMEHIYSVAPSNGYAIDTITLPNEARPFDLTELLDSSLLVSTNRGLLHLREDGSILHNYVKKKPLHLAAESENLIVYTTKTDFSTVENSVSVFNAVTGDDYELATFINEKIEDILVHENNLYLLLSSYGSLRLVRTQLENFDPLELHVQKEISGGISIAAIDGYIYLLCNSLLMQFKEDTLYCRTVLVPDAEAIMPLDKEHFYVRDKSNTMYAYKKESRCNARTICEERK